MENWRNWNCPGWNSANSTESPINLWVRAKPTCGRQATKGNVNFSSSRYFIFCAQRRRDAKSFFFASYLLRAGFTSCWVNPLISLRLSVFAACPAALRGAILFFSPAPYFFYSRKGAETQRGFFLAPASRLLGSTPLFLCAFASLRAILFLSLARCAPK